MKVLVLESGRLFQKVLRDLLLKLDCSADCASSAEEGFALLQDKLNTDYDLIIVSQSIFNQHLQEITEYSANSEHNVPIILLSSNADEDLHVNASSAGIKNIFPKTNLDYLKSCIRYYIKGEQSDSLNNGEVLYIEDSPSVAHIVKSYLKKTGIEVTHYVHADEAFKAFTSGAKNYDLIITDITLKGEMDGLSLVRMIRAENSPIAMTPILTMTGNDDLQLRNELLNAGATDYITKPVNEEGFLTRIKNLITIKRLTDKVNQQRRTLHKLTITDPLTGCQNKNSLTKYGKKFINDAIRYKYPLSIFVIEIDSFKQLQETHGRDTSEKVLQRMGESLLKNCRQGDVVARIGGEEFSVLLPHCTIESALGKAVKILSKIQRLQPENIPVTASIGISLLCDEYNEDFSMLYQSAKDASLSSRKNGKNQITANTQSLDILQQAKEINIGNTQL